MPLKTPDGVFDHTPYPCRGPSTSRVAPPHGHFVHPRFSTMPRTVLTLGAVRRDPDGPRAPRAQPHSVPAAFGEPYPPPSLARDMAHFPITGFVCQFPSGCSRRMVSLAVCFAC